MAQRIDGWTLMGRIVASPERFEACDTTVALAALLLLRSQLVQGVTNERGLLELADVVGQAPMIEVIENLAGYEAVRVAGNISPSEERTTAAAARKRLIAIVKREAEPHEPAASAPRLSEPISGAAPGRALRRHRAMGARRIRPTG